ncbi:MAG: rRNA maturation RNase YbeY [Clostridiales bacterium]|nr:rRNA maturation RNase YbeY [Clostridiales bacterium]
MITLLTRKKTDCAPLLTAFCKELGISEPYVVELEFTSPRKIRKTNRETRGVDRVTDILSFPTLSVAAGDLPTVEAYPLDGDGEGNLFLGSLLVCLKKCKKQAKEFGHSKKREINYLLCHGLLHLLGYDHEQEDDKRVMREKEEAVMARMNLTR